MELIENGGPFGWLLLLLILTAIFFALKSAFQIWKNEKIQKHIVEGSLSNLLWTGIVSEAVGVLGTVLGMHNASIAISRAKEVSPVVVWKGVSIALITTVWGLAIFVLCTIVWMVLRSQFRNKFAE